MSNRGKGGLPVTHMRFVYNYHPYDVTIGEPLVYGEWTPIAQARSLFPNPEYKDRLSHVEFKEAGPWNPAAECSDPACMQDFPHGEH
jgi:hypothetical protein